MNTSTTLFVTKSEEELLGNLKWLAEKLEKLGNLRNEKITASVALRHAIAMDALMLDEMSSKSKILIEKKNGKTTEIRIDRDSLFNFKQNFADHPTEKSENELITAKFGHEILGNIKWIAVKLEDLGNLSKNSVTLSIALRHAIAMDALMLDEMDEDSRIFIHRKNDKNTEIRVDRQSVLSFKETFANNLVS